MSLVPGIIQLLESADARGVRRDNTAGTVWRLDGSRAAVERVRDEILNRVLANGDVFIAYDISPDAPGLTPYVAGSPSEGFQVTSGAPVAAVRQWLYMGNWILTQPARRLPPSDPARMSAAEIEATVARHELVCVIDSFHDDVSWTLGLRRSHPTDPQP